MEPCCRYLDLGYHTGSRHDGGRTKWGGPLPCGGGFERASLDKLDGLRWYHSGAGGTRVQCPSHAVNVVAKFNEAMRTLKAGGEASVQCPECGETFDLNALHFRPEAAVGYAAIVFRDVASAQLERVCASVLFGTRSTLLWCFTDLAISGMP